MTQITRRREGREDIATLGPLAAIEPLRSMWALLADPAREYERALRWEQERAFIPRFDVKETPDAYVLKADLPGVPEEEVEISVVGNRLTISGQREMEERREGENFVASERSYGAFTRTFLLPDGAEGARIEASLNDGVLTITVPKRPEVQPKRIELKSESRAGAKPAVAQAKPGQPSQPASGGGQPSAGQPSAGQPSTGQPGGGKSP